MATYVNKFGRKGGRGLRPWLLIPKVLGVGVYFGGTVAATSLAFVTQPRTVGEHRALAEVIGSIFLFAAVPGLIVAIVCGVGLLIQHGRPFLRLRWLQVKLAVLLATIPALHLWMSSHVKRLSAFDPAQSGRLLVTSTSRTVSSFTCSTPSSGKPTSVRTRSASATSVGRSR